MARAKRRPHVFPFAGVTRQPVTYTLWYWLPDGQAGSNKAGWYPQMTDPKLDNVKLFHNNLWLLYPGRTPHPHKITAEYVTVTRTIVLD